MSGALFGGGVQYARAGDQRRILQPEDRARLGQRGRWPDRYSLKPETMMTLIDETPGLTFRHTTISPKRASWPTGL